MPIYEYQCVACGHADSFLERMDASANKTCPKCRKRRAFKRLISAAGFQLKGQGWYATDFKDKRKSAGDGNSNGKENADKTQDNKKTDKKPDKQPDKQPDKKPDKKADKPA